MYIKRLIIVFFLVLGISWLTGKLYDHRYKKRWDYLYFDKIDHLIKSDSSYDIIFLGDSRVHHGINPFYVDSVSGLNSYNFGFPGSDAAELKLSSQLYLQNHPHPRVAVLVVNTETLGPARILKQRFPYLYYFNNDTVASYMRQNGFPVAIKYLPFLKYSFFDEYNKMSIFINGKQVPRFAHNNYKGFLNVDEFINRKGAVVFGNDVIETISDSAVNYIKEALDIFAKLGIKTVLVYPPEKKSSPEYSLPVKKQADSIFHGLAASYKIPFWHFDTAAVYTDEYFVDAVHLNEPGSRIFSGQIADSIKTFLK